MHMALWWGQFQQMSADLPKTTCPLNDGKFVLVYEDLRQHFYSQHNCGLWKSWPNSHFRSHTAATSIFSNTNCWKLCRSSVRSIMRIRRWFLFCNSHVGCRFHCTKPHDLTRNAHRSLARSILANISNFAENDLSTVPWQIRCSVWGFVLSN